MSPRLPRAPTRPAAAAVIAIQTAAPKDCRGTYTVSNGYRLVAGDTCDPTGGVDHLPTVKRCPGLFGGAAAEVSSSGWTVLLVLLLLLGVLAFVTMRNRGVGLADLGSLLPTDLPTLLGMLAAIPGFLASLPATVMGLRESWRASRAPAYGRLPESADDELDLGDDDMLDDEAEELGDGDVFDEESSRLSTLPAAGAQATPTRAGAGRATGGEVGSLIGDDFTSPHANVKKGD